MKNVNEWISFDFLKKYIIYAAYQKNSGIFNVPEKEKQSDINELYEELIQIYKIYGYNADFQ